MKRNKLRVIQITGIRGLLSAGFIVTCLIAGFVGFPALMLCKLWNHFADSTGLFPYINMFQGLILWAILAISYIIINRKQHYLIAFEPKNNNREIKDIIEEIKSQSASIKAEVPKTFETQEVKIQNTQNNTKETEEKSKEVV